MGTCLKSPELYTVGWIAALSIERAAATALLHERHDTPEGFHQSESDTNAYTWGRVAKHNVVIASLPAGVYGNVSSATTVSSLVHSLPHIRIGVLVGIGGGIAKPDLDQDIRLGDIVVSQPEGTTGGVIQYDLGKAKSVHRCKTNYAKGVWERKGSLDKPPPVLLNALASLQAEHEIAPSKIPDLLQAMLENNPQMKKPKTDFRYQGAENDRLFQSQYDHVSGAICGQCDSSQEVDRDPRDSTDPDIHYGVIASGNSLIRDATARDSLWENTGRQCLCVEMEAAGLMDRFPCLVIRGICDYADSHKNDRWQRYAAAAAAAFAVELLGFVPDRELRATKKVVDAIQALEQRVNIIGTVVQKFDHDITLDRLPVAEGASFDSHTKERNSQCLPDTRVQLLKDIYHWIDHPKSKKMFWLHGMAGTGKSTIARTVAQSRRNHGDLGPTFFFKRGEFDRSSLVKFVPTISRQLASKASAIKFAVKSAIDADPEIIGKSIGEQFKRLVEEPLLNVQTAETAPSSLVIVIDALDECNGDDDIRLLILLLSGLCSTILFHVRIFVTSRPELPIRLGFGEINHDNNYQDLELHRIPPPIIELDISIFIHHEFEKIREDFNLAVAEELKLTANWPSKPELNKLTIAASPLFISAATICRFVSDSWLGSPRELLQKALETTSDVHNSRLSGFYSLVLEQQTAKRSERERNDIIKSFQLVVGSIISLASPLSQRALARLLGMHVGAVDARLRVLHSVLDVPEDPDLPVRLLHLSFRDFLVTEKTQFWVNETLTHNGLAKSCLRVMNETLKRNICRLPFPGTRRSELDRRTIQNYIPPELEYGCRYWVHHQIVVRHTPEDYRQIDDFLQNHLLHWLEVMSLIGRSEDILGALRDLASWLEEINCEGHLAFVQDAVRLARSNVLVIDGAPLQVYSSILAFAPRRSLVRQSYENKVPSWLSLWPQVKRSWDMCLLAIVYPDIAMSVALSHDSRMMLALPVRTEGRLRIWSTETGKCEQEFDYMHDDRVQSAVFSPDSKMVALGYYNGNVRIWNTQTGKCEQVLKDHNDSVLSMAFSHNSKLLASGSADTTIRIWNIRTGKCERLFQRHCERVILLAFLSGSDTIYSLCEEKIIRIWNSRTGECERVLECTSERTDKMVFSHDLTKVVSSSRDNAVTVWEMQTGRCEQALEGHNSNIKCVALAHDLKTLGSADQDNTIRVWNIQTGKSEQILRAHSSEITSVVFSHDSSMMVSASYDHTIRLWDTRMREVEQTVESHDAPVWSIVISPDLKKVVSGASDGTVRIWNTQMGSCEQVLEGHTSDINSLVFSHDLTMVVTASSDKAARIWKTNSNQCTYVLKGHTRRVESAIFSYDSRIVATASYDTTARIWDTKTGKCKQLLQGHLDGVHNLLFSHNSKKLVSASFDDTLRIWDVQTGACEQVLEGHTEMITSMALSQDSQILASCSYDKTIRIWNVQTGNCTRTLKGHSRDVTSVILSYNSLMLASVSRDGTARIWNMQTGTCDQVREVDFCSLTEPWFEPYNWSVIIDDIFSFSAHRPQFFETETPASRVKDLKLGLRDETWITMAGRNLLWLPAEFRERCQRVAISADTVAIGCHSGRVLILKFSEVEMANL